ncbi:MAG: hypothetical protein HY064_17235 [Bacteroidetes bacterium]|nr:hypothetical protein [Bacteroidota bacterium]
MSAELDPEPKKREGWFASHFKSIREKFSDDERTELKIILPLSLAVYFLLAYCYPTTHITADSGDYVACAQANLFGGFRPVGYSWFLHAVHFFSHALAFVNLVQFCFHIIATVFFAFTVRQFFPPASKWMFRIFLFLVVFNFTDLHMTTWLLSDSLSASLTFFSFTLFIRILMEPHKWMMTGVFLVVIFFLCKVRYASLAYLPACSLVFLFAHPFRKIIVHVLLCGIVFAGVWFSNVLENKIIFSENTFSAFGGWAKANDASILLPYIEKIKPDEWNDQEAEQAYDFIRKFSDTCFTEEKTFNTDFMWNNSGPGKYYFNLMRFINRNSTEMYTKTWVHTGCVYDKYAAVLIRKYPGKYFRYFILPNAKRLFVPHNDITPFNIAAVPAVCKKWFGIKYDHFYVNCDFFLPLEKSGYYIYQLFFTLLFPVFFICFFFRKKLKIDANEKKILAALAVFLISGFLLLIWAHPVMYRYVAWQKILFLLPLYALVNAVIRRKKNESLPS